MKGFWDGGDGDGGGGGTGDWKSFALQELMIKAGN